MLKHRTIRRPGLLLATLGAVGLLATEPMLPVSIGPTQALADDDDGGDDDGGGGGGGGGAASGPSSSGGGGPTFRPKRSLFKLRKAKRPRAAKATPRETRKAAVPRRQKKTVATKTKRRPVAQAPHRQAAPKPSTRRDLPTYASRQLVLRSVTDTELLKLRQSGFAEVKRHADPDGNVIVLVETPKGIGTRQALNRVRERGLAADLNHFFRNEYSPQSASFCKGETCEHHNIVAWSPALATCALATRIGVIDTNVDRGHVALAGMSLEVVDVVPVETAPTDHGTAVVSLLAGKELAESRGLVPTGNIVLASVFTKAANNDVRTDAYSLASAITELLKRDVKLINMSLAGPANDVLTQSVKSAVAQGAMIVAAAGNGGPSAPAPFPAALEDVVTVSAVSTNLNIYRRSGRGDHIDLTAPGVAIPAADVGGETSAFNGSSFSAPFVTAALALTWTGKPIETLEAVYKSAKDIGVAGKDPLFGNGLVQMPASCAPAAPQ